VDRFLVELREAVDAAAAAKAPTLVVCRYCGNLVAPEHAIDVSTCHGCGSSVFGIVY
jgi:ribosomal protein L32